VLNKGAGSSKALSHTQFQSTFQIWTKIDILLHVLAG